MAQGSSKKMGIEVKIQLSETLFHEEQIRAMEGYKKGPDFVEVKCGCTSRKYGDSMATLKVYSNGQFLIKCECYGCKGETFTPYEFERHAGKEGTSKWPSHIWVRISEKKVPLWRTELLKYYRHSSNGASGSQKRNFHRDEFISCYRCKKERRFRLRNKDDCRVYHDALGQKRWKCSDWLYDKITCKDEEERVSRRSCRGCPRSSSCQGCTSCVCFGCLKCRFVDCNCRTCVDFMENAKP